MNNNVIIPLLSSIGIVANVSFGCLIYYYDSSRSSMLFMALVCASDAITLFIHGIVRMSLSSWDIVNLSNVSPIWCKVTNFVYSAVAFASQNQLVLMSCDRFLAITYSKYKPNLMLKTKYPIRCTIINYVLCAFLMSPLLLRSSIDPLTSQCLREKTDFDQSSLFFIIISGTMFHDGIPILVIVFTNTFCVWKIRSCRRTLRVMGIRQPCHEEIEHWITSGSIFMERMERNGRAYLEEQRKRHVDSVPMKDVPINTHLKATHDDSSQDARQTSPL
ncbi:uncharacterized protein LOC142338116 [Convolutriloba macropyga]|uniref:uncharacterized protein LOC142338116 n=1 Tax=Convolutriloba macropyga TaxID=536237 RepID=UPI003F51C994